MLASYHFGFMFFTLVLNYYSRMSKGLSVRSLLTVVKSIFSIVSSDKSYSMKVCTIAIGL
jgi:hypothetical protein